MNREPLYVFSYGSLMWDPGFEFEEWSYGVVDGYHRSPCIYSTIYRGTEAQPGLVFGLDTGGQCEGILYKVNPKNIDNVIGYLRKREMPTGLPVYEEAYLSARTDRGIFSALSFVANRNCIKYAGHLTDAKRVELIARGRGQNGSCLEYYQNSLERLAQMGVHDSYLISLTCRAEIFAARQTLSDVA